MSLERERASPRPPEFFEKLLLTRVPQYRLDLAGPVVGRLAGYLAELDIWRRRSNLTGRLTPEELVEHALESALGTSLIPQNARVVDVGSGAGFPGLPLAIVRSDLEITLVEPRTKRCAFLRHVVRTLGLSNVRVAQARIEDLGDATFDVATTRAVGRFPEWLADARFLEPQGALLAWTTGPDSVGRGFALERALRIPGSSKGRIAAFRRTS